MPSSTVNDLIKNTSTFFELHWNAAIINMAPPAWSDAWKLPGAGSWPNHTKQGVYALLKGSDVIYVGVAASTGSGIYEGAGLGARLKNYLMRDPNSKSEAWIARDDWKDIDSLMTIGFEKGYGHLAYALEPYLIDKLDPLRNKIKTGRGKS